MLPSKITNHPFFHQNLSEAQAKEILKSKSENTCLFTAGKNKDDLTFWYTASFKGEKQVRSFKFAFYDGKIKLPSSNATFVSLYDAANHLCGFLKGFSDNPFTPLPYYSKPLALNNLAKLDHVPEVLPPLHNGHVVEYIFPLLKPLSLLTLSQVSKNWNALITDKHIERSLKGEDNATLAVQDKLRKEMKDIAKTLSEQLPINTTLSIRYGMYTISKPEHYTDHITFYTLNGGDYHNQTIRVEKQGRIIKLPDYQALDTNFLPVLKDILNNGTIDTQMQLDDLSAPQLNLS